MLEKSFDFRAVKSKSAQDLYRNLKFDYFLEIGENKRHSPFVLPTDRNAISDLAVEISNKEYFIGGFSMFRRRYQVEIRLSSLSLHMARCNCAAGKELVRCEHLLRIYNYYACLKDLGMVELIIEKSQHVCLPFRRLNVMRLVDF